MDRTKIMSILIVACFFGVSLPAMASPLDDLLPSALPSQEERYVVGFHELPALEVGDDYQGARVVEVVERLRYVVVETRDIATFELRASTDENVRYVEWDDPHYATVMFVPNDARYNEAGHWGSKKIGAEVAWDRTLGSTSIKVGVIDSGLRKTHEDFSGSGRVLAGYDFHNNDNDPNDDCGHGTHVAGTIAATINNGKGIAGMAQVTVLPIKGLGNSFWGCSGSLTGLANSLRYAADEGSHFSSNSWGGGGSSSALNDAIVYAYNKGVTQVAAAGNSGACTNCVGQPWKDNPTRTIIVSSTTSSDGFSSFSSEGPEVDVAAPGSSILSAWHTSDTAYNTISGTSMAAPHVTGALALVKTLNPGFGYAQLDQRIKDTAVDLGASGFDHKFGHGRINADAATAGGGSTPNQPPTASFTYSCTNLSCSFNGGGSSDSDGSITSYAWTFGDGSSGSGVSPSRTYAAAGTYSVKLTVTDDDGATGSQTRSVTVTAPPSSPTTVYYEDFDDGSAAGWSKSSSSDLWHLSTGCVSAYSPSHKLAWTRSSYCDYNTGSRVTNWARSGAISLAGKSSAELTFVHQFQTESYSGGAYDILRVEVSSTGSSWTTLQQWDSRNANVNDWTRVTYDVSAWAGGDLYVRYYADTVDSTANNYRGWFVDNVEVKAS